MATTPTTKKAPAPKAGTRRILITKNDGSRVLVEDIPANAKVTYGKVQPGPGYGQCALRIYTVESNQLAIFCDVESFRDLSLTVKEQRVEHKLRSDAEVGPNGRYTEEAYTEVCHWEEVSLDSMPSRREGKDLLARF